VGARSAKVFETVIDSCLFCRIAAGDAPSYRIFEDDQTVSVLDIFPAVRGQVVVLSKAHLPSDVFALGDTDYQSLLRGARSTAAAIQRILHPIRICMVTEGMEIDHAHVKLYPIHSVISSVSAEVEDLNEYRGFISTKHGARAADDELARLASAFLGAEH
jgi:diadenosine tetraphosphate (Ap4A) HIT family hydrolase